MKRIYCLLVLPILLLSAIIGCSFTAKTNPDLLCNMQDSIVSFDSVPEIETSFKRRKNNSDLLLNMMKEDAFFRPYLDRVKDYEIQIIYTQIDRDSCQVPSFTQYSYRLNNKEYFNPASLVKWPLILMGMEKINNLRDSFPEISIYNKVEYLGSTSCTSPVTEDKLAFDNTPRLANYIKEMILVSDDNAYNRMYDFLGQEYLNKRLEEMGYDSLRVMARFAPCTKKQNRFTPSINFYNENGKLIYKQPEAFNSTQLSNPLGKVLKGTAHQNGGGIIVNEPKDYSYFNNMCLQDINDLILFILFKEVAPENKKFNLTDEDYELLHKYTAMYPCESEFPPFQNNKQKYPVHLKKYLYYGKNSSISDVPGLRIHNMVGESHGTLSDVAYFVNKDSGVEFMLSAVINTCYDGIIAPSHYHYIDKGQPFLARLGKMIYSYELRRRESVIK